MNRLVMKSELTVDAAAAIRDGLCEFIESDSDLELDLSGITRVDSSGLQLLLAASREAARINHRLRFINPSACVTEALELVNLFAMTAG